MEAIRDIIGKNVNKSKDNDDRVNTGPDTSSAYRSSDASGERDVGTKSYSRDTGVSRDDWDDRRQNDPNASSYARGDSSYSGSGGLDGERSTSGYSGDSGRDNNDYGYSGGDDDNDYGTSGGLGLNSGRQQSSKKYSHRSGDDDDSGNYSSYPSGATGASIGDDDTGDMGGGAHGSRGMYGSASQSGRSSGMGTSGGNQSYGSYSSTDNYD